jgi:hypothetical protein
MENQISDLVQPGGPGRCKVRMTLGPAIILGFVGIEVVENDMDSRIRSRVAARTDEVIE